MENLHLCPPEKLCWAFMSSRGLGKNKMFLLLGQAGVTRGDPGYCWGDTNSSGTAQHPSAPFHAITEGSFIRKTVNCFSQRVLVNDVEMQRWQEPTAPKFSFR